VDKFFAGYRAFRDDYFKKHRAMIAELMTRKQSPEAMMIACSDSRIDPSLKFGADPGDLFMVRNVAALVPPYMPDSEFHGTSAAVEFAVKVLEVKNIIVMGHARCGGIQALVNHEGRAATDFVAGWMRIAEPALARTYNIAKPEDRQRVCEHEAVKESLNNLMTFPWVKAKIDGGDLTLHGWYFDLESGTLHVLDKTTCAFAPAPT